MITIVCLATAHGQASAQLSGLIGGGMSNMPPQRVAKGKFLKNGDMEATATGDLLETSAIYRRVIHRLAEMTRERGFPQFVIVADRCSSGTSIREGLWSSCWIRARMITAEEAVTEAARQPLTYISVDRVLGTG